MKNTPYGNIDDKDLTEDELAYIENNFHKNAKQRYNNKNLGIYLLFVNTLANPIEGGRSRSDYGAVVTTKFTFIGNRMQHGIGHEIGHCLGLANAFDKPFDNYMNYGDILFNLMAYFFSFYPGMHFDEVQWNNMNLKNKWSTD